MINKPCVLTLHNLHHCLLVIGQSIYIFACHSFLKWQPENCCNIGIIDIHSTHIHDRWFSEMIYRWMSNDLWLDNCYGISVWQMTWICSICGNHNLSFHHSWLITEFVTIVTRKAPLVEHSLFLFIWLVFLSFFLAV